MILVIGGAYQGKLEYVQRALRIRTEDIADGAEGVVAFQKPVINRFHLLVKKMYEDGTDTSSQIIELLAVGRSKVIIADEVGLGILSLDKNDREWQSLFGTVLQIVAKHSDSVIRVHCGIPNVIKRGGHMGFLVTFIRHGRTKSNAEGKYCGIIDEPLSQEGIAELNKLWVTPPKVDFLYTSPMKRCIETAEIIAPDMPYNLAIGLSECNFGDFEGKTHDELKDLPEYIAFRESKGMGAIPNGESGMEFRQRCVDAFIEIIDNMIDSRLENIGIVCHGGTIMAILSYFDIEGRPFYDFMVENGQGFTTEYDLFEEKIKILGKV